MSEFIVIAPSDYVRMDIDELVNSIGWDLGQLKMAEENQYYNDLNEAMVNAGVMPDGKEGVTGIKLVEDRELYVKFD